MGIIHSLSVLLDFALGIYTGLILIRVVLSWVNPDPYNPIVQFLVRATEPVLEPLRRIIPPLAGMDLSPIVALLGISLLQRLISAFARGIGMGAFSMLFVELLNLVHLLMTFYFLLLLVRAGLHIHSWFLFRRARSYRLDLNNGLVRFVFQSTEQVVGPLRRWVPTFSGLDVTPLVAAAGLLLLLSFLQNVTLTMAAP